MCDPVTSLVKGAGDIVSTVAGGLAGGVVGGLLGKKAATQAAAVVDPAAERAAAEATAAQTANAKLAADNRRRRAATSGSLLSQGQGASQVTFGDSASTSGSTGLTSKSSLLSRGGVSL